MDFLTEKQKRFSRWLIGLVALCILLYLGVRNIGAIAGAVSWVVELLRPVLVGFAMALILNVPMRFFESHMLTKTTSRFGKAARRPLAFVVSLVLILGILAGVIWLIIPELVKAVTLLMETVSEFIRDIAAMEKEDVDKLPFGQLILDTDWDKMLNTLQGWLSDKGSTIVNTALVTLGSLVRGVFDLFISLVLAVYILFSKEKLKKQAMRLVRAWLPKHFGHWIAHATAVAGKNFRNFVSGQSIEALILGSLCTIGMLILGFPYAPQVGALVGVTALVPIIGAFIGAGVGAFLILTVSPVKALLFVVFLVVLQQLEGNLIYPRVMGNRVNLPSLWVLASVTIGGGLGGAIGMLLSVPAASTVYVLVKEATKKREAEIAQKEQEESEESA